MSGFADRIFGYFAILQRMSGFADRILLHTHVHVPGTDTVPAPQILRSVDYDFVSEFGAKNIGYFQPWQILNHRIFANP